LDTTGVGGVDTEVVAEVAAENTPVPAIVLAATWKEYVLPLVRPVYTFEVPVDVPPSRVLIAPPFSDNLN
jgi:hypothetical protein